MDDSVVVMVNGAPVRGGEGGARSLWRWWLRGQRRGGQ